MLAALHRLHLASRIF